MMSFPIRLDTAKLFALVICALMGFKGTSAAAASNDAASRAVASAPLETLQVQGNVYLIGGAGANVTALVGDEGVLVVDTGDGTATEALLSELRKLSPKKINHIINTTANADRVGGNATLSAAGRNPSMEPAAFRLSTDGQGALIHGHENAMLEMAKTADGARPIKQDNWPNRTFFRAKTALHYDAEPIELIHAPNAISTGDVIVFFRKSDVISAGSIFSTVAYPVIDASRGGTIQGVLDGLNRIIDIAIPRINQEGGTRIVPAHGRVSNESDVVEYRDMLTIIRDRIKVLVESGATLEEVKKAKPTLDYDGIYDERIRGVDWTAEKFIEAVYLELKGKP